MIEHYMSIVRVQLGFPRRRVASSSSPSRHSWASPLPAGGSAPPSPMGCYDRHPHHPHHHHRRPHECHCRPHHHTTASWQCSQPSIMGLGHFPPWTIALILLLCQSFSELRNIDQSQGGAGRPMWSPLRQLQPLLTSHR